MDPVKPTGAYPNSTFIEIAKDQPEYRTLPAYVSGEGVVYTEWELTPAERAEILAGGRIRLAVWTFNRALQPILLEVAPSTMGDTVASWPVDTSERAYNLTGPLELPATVEPHVCTRSYFDDPSAAWRCECGRYLGRGESREEFERDRFGETGDRK